MISVRLEASAWEGDPPEQTETSWTTTINPKQSLRELVSRWLRRYQVNATLNAAFRGAALEEPDSDIPLDLDRTPTQMNWKSGEPCRTLWVVPLDESNRASVQGVDSAPTPTRAAKAPNGLVRPRGDELLPGAKRICRSAPEASSSGSTQRKSVEFEVILDKSLGKLGISVAAPLERHLEVSEIKQGPGLVRDWNHAHPDATIQLGDSIVEVNGKRDSGAILLEELKSSSNQVLKLKIISCSSDSSVRSQSSPASSSSAKKEAPARPAPARVKKEPSNAPAVRVKQEKKEPVARVKKEQGQEKDSKGPAPSGDDAIVFEQVNPKKVGGKSRDRYEKYKMATSPKEAIEKGAVPGDIENDWRKGYMKRAT